MAKWLSMLGLLPENLWFLAPKASGFQSPVAPASGDLMLSLLDYTLGHTRIQDHLKYKLVMVAHISNTNIWKV